MRAVVFLWALAGACYAPARSTLPEATLVDARSAVLLVPDGELTSFLPIDVDNIDEVKWSEATRADQPTLLYIYGCGRDEYSLPSDPTILASVCLPPTERRWRFDPAQGVWIEDPGEQSSKRCDRCDLFPIVETQRIAASMGDLGIFGAVVLDAQTILISAADQTSGGDFGLYIGRFDRDPPFERLVIEAALGLGPPTFEGLARADDGTVFGVHDAHLWSIRIEGNHARAEQADEYELVATKDSSTRLLFAGPNQRDLYVASGKGGLYRRRGGSWTLLASPRATTPDRSLEYEIELTPFGDDDVAAIGIGTSSTSDYVDDGIEIAMLRYYTSKNGGSSWALPSREEAVSIAQLDGETYVLGNDGGLFALRADGSLGTELTVRANTRMHRLRGASGRLLTGGRDGGLWQIFPDQLTTCPPVEARVARELFADGEQVFLVSNKSLDVATFRAPRVAECGLGPIEQ